MLFEPYVDADGVSCHRAVRTGLLRQSLLFNGYWYCGLSSERTTLDLEFRSTQYSGTIKLEPQGYPAGAPSGPWEFLEDANLTPPTINLIADGNGHGGRISCPFTLFPYQWTYDYLIDWNPSPGQGSLIQIADTSDAPMYFLLYLD